PVEDEAGFVEALRALARRSGAALPVFPTHDPPLNALARHLDESLLAPFPAWDRLADVQSKRSQLERATAAGIDVPETRHPRSASSAGGGCSRRGPGSAPAVSARRSGWRRSSTQRCACSARSTTTASLRSSSSGTSATVASS